MGVTAKPNPSRQNQKTSRQNQMPHGKTKYLHGKSKNFTAKSNISRQNQKRHGKHKNVTAKPNHATAEAINTSEVTSSFPVPTLLERNTRTPNVVASQSKAFSLCSFLRMLA